MPQLRSRAKAPGPAAAPSSPSPAAAAGGPSGTPAPSPTTSLDLGLGSPDDAAGPLKSPVSAPPRRSLRLAGAASPATPTFAPSSSGSGSGSGRTGSRRGRGRGRARSSASPAASPIGAGDSGSGLGAKDSAGGGGPGAGTFMSLRSASRGAKRQVETGARVVVEAAAGFGGDEDGPQVHDEMLQRDAGAQAKRFKRMMVAGVETEYVADSESGSDDDCVMLGEVCTKLQLSFGPSVVQEGTVPVNMDRIEEVVGDDPAGTGKEEFLGGGSVPTYNFWAAGSVELEPSPVGIPLHLEKEICTDVYFEKELTRYDTGNGSKGEGKLVLGNNDSGADASVGIQDGTSAQKCGPDSKGKGKMGIEDGLSSSSSSEDEMEFHSVPDSKDNPADQLVSLINRNRTASKASSLADNQGLGCISLQYIKAFQGQCNQVGKNMKPVESSFTDKFAPDCGVQAATVAKITGRLLACQSNYASPDEAFNILIDDAKSLQVLHSKNHTEVGAAISGTDGGGPYFFCVLFSDGKPSTSFKVDGGEVPKTAIHPGCFSGNNDDCKGPNNGAVSSSVGVSRLLGAILFAVACVFAL